MMYCHDHHAIKLHRLQFQERIKRSDQNYNQESKVRRKQIASW
jgi:hypothetical protein